MTTRPTQDPIVTQRAYASAEALKTYLSIRGLKDGEIFRAFARFEAEIEAATIERCAEIGYAACTETRHVALGNKVRTAIRNLKGQTS